MSSPIHLRPTAPVAERALLPGDPGRALALAQLLIERPKMFNHHRGLWGYSGPAHLDGEPLTVQSTGMGGPSAAIVLHELIELGVRRAIRVGTCGALDPALSLGELVCAREAIAADGTGAALAGARRTRPHPGLLERLAAAAPTARVDTVVSTDLFYEADAERGPDTGPGPDAGPGPNPGSGPNAERDPNARRNPDTGPGAAWRRQGAIAVEMEAAALFALGERAGIAVACLLATSDTFDGAGERTRIDDRALLAAAEAMGRAATAALAD